MSTTPARIRRRRGVILVIALVILAVGITVAIASQASPQIRRGVAEVVGTVMPSPPGSAFEESPEHGFIATGQTIELTDDDLPSIANLNPELLAAAREAAEAAQREQGIHLVVTSGWRSAAYQQWLLDQAVARYGSAEEAAKWVSTPEVSRHVTGEALDIGPFDGTLWMQSNAERFGLCQIYSNELWHYELASAFGGTCPALRESAAG
jgi:zinc D-Ala-D-Ala carboxypeptidase